jgi:hypothetical protein
MHGLGVNVSVPDQLRHSLARLRRPFTIFTMCAQEADGLTTVEVIEIVQSETNTNPPTANRFAIRSPKLA